MRCLPFSEPADDGLPLLPSLPGNLPAELNRFVGRRAELTEVERRLGSARLVTVIGVAGVGKSRCALRVALRQQERFCDGVWLVELAGLHEDASALEHTVSAALGLADQVGTPSCFSLADQLADRELLLVLDGYEHLAAKTAELVCTLLRRAPRLRVLAAGRCPLEISGEQVFPLPPMETPDPGLRPGGMPAPELAFADALSVEVDPGPGASPGGPIDPPDDSGPGLAAPLGEAATLFADRAAAVLPGFTVNAANQQLVAELCHRLDGIPLALELAAGRLRTLSLEQLLHRLHDRFRLLVGGSHDAPAHHRTLRTAIGWSHELCSPRERLLWARLSVFAGHFDLEAAEYVCAGSALPASEIIDTVDALVAGSVVLREESRIGVLYRMPESLRLYGADWLDALGDTVRIRRRHRDWYTGLATWCELDWFSPRQAEVAARIDQELPNLRAALECALECEEDTRLGAYLASTLGFYWTSCGRLAEGRHWLDRALEQDAGQQEAQLKALWVAGHVAALQGDTAHAYAVLQECRQRAERTGNLVALAYCLHRTGGLALFSGDPPGAEELIRTALIQYEEVGELNSTVLMGKVELAAALALQGDVAGAAALCEAVRKVCADHGERWALSRALCTLGYLACVRGETALAKELLEECLSVGQGFHDLVGTVLAVETLALVRVDEGEPDEAAVLLGASRQLWRSAGLPRPSWRFAGVPQDRCEQEAREQLGPRRFAECLRTGARLDPKAVAARALRTPGAQPPHRRAEPRGAVPEDPPLLTGRTAASPSTG